MVQNPFAFFEERYLKHGPIFRSSLVYPVVWMMGAEANRTIMVSGRENFSYAGGYGQLAFGKLFQQNILLLDGEEHLRTRTLLEPAVNRLGLGEVIDQVQSIWDSAADKLERRPHGDVYDIAQRATFEASAMALTGLKDGSELDAMRPHFEAMIVGAMAHTKLRYPNGILDRGLKSRDVLVDMLRPHIERARRDPEPKGFLGRLAQDKDEHGRYLPIEDVIHHTMLLFWAGYDTTASAGSWVLHLLAHHPEWQDRIRENVWDALGDEPYQLKGSAKLTTLSWFLREVERCGPSLTMFPRTAMRDFEFGGYTVPAGTPVFWSPWMSQRCPEAFPHPHAFDPGRWDPRAARTRPRASTWWASAVGRACAWAATSRRCSCASWSPRWCAASTSSRTPRGRSPSRGCPRITRWTRSCTSARCWRTRSAAVARARRWPVPAASLKPTRRRERFASRPLRAHGVHVGAAHC
ncbi:MAG: cytochrome P450 [Sandaracinaceae bacterium]|nr:cytochrome P450 [Sandaracinaceae bacterium]